MSNGHRWSKFWWQDWANDPALRMCCLAAQGLWMRLLCVMHEAVPVGHLVVNGKPPSTKQIAALASASEKEVATLLVELEGAGVYSRTSEGVIYSRRMVRDAAASEAGREHIAKRWNGGAKPTPPNSPPTKKPDTPPIRGGNSQPTSPHNDASEIKLSVQTLATEALSRPSAPISPPNRGPTDDPTKGAASHPTRPPNTLEAEAETDSASLRSAAHAHEAVSAALDPRQALWNEGVDIVKSLIGNGKTGAQRFVGMLLRTSQDAAIDGQDDPPRVLNALRQALDLRPIDPKSWLVAACGGGKSQHQIIHEAIGGRSFLEPDPDPGDADTPPRLKAIPGGRQ